MTKNSEMEAKVAILDKCCQSVECLARGKVFDLVGTLDLPQSSFPETKTALERLDKMAGCLIVDGTPVDAYGRFELTYGDLRALRAALTAGLAQTTQQWQPIETAPKDGTVVDLWCIESREKYAPRRLVGRRYGRMTNWVGEEVVGWNVGDPFRDWRPTHWMPQPAAPTVEDSSTDRQGE